MASCPLAAAEQRIGEGGLNLLPASSQQNRLSLKITATVSGTPAGTVTVSDTRTADASGLLAVRLGVDEDSPQSLEISEGSRVALTDMTFHFTYRFLIFNIDVGTLQTSGLGGEVFTPEPPASVGTGGVFDAEDHAFRIDRGNGRLESSFIDGDAEIDFSEMPLEGRGSGQGTVTLVRLGETAEGIMYRVRLALPVSMDQTEILDGNTVRIEASGNLRAEGTILVPPAPGSGDDFESWAEQVRPGGVAFDELAASGLPFGVLWALGVEPGGTLEPMSLQVSGDQETAAATLDLPEGGNRHPVLVEVSSDLGEWRNATEAELPGIGTNPLPPGATGVLTISLGPDARFVRLRVEEP